MKLEISGTMFDLNYTVNSVCDLEEITGKGIGDILAVNGFSSVRALLWCGLIEGMPGLTIKKAGNILEEYVKGNSLEQLAKALGEAVEQAGFLAGKPQAKPPKAK